MSSDNTDKQELIIKDFQDINNWEDRYYKLISMGKSLEEMPEENKIDNNKVSGCQSQVWLTASLTDNKTVKFQSSSDALIVKGIIALLLEVYSEQTPEYIINTRPEFIQAIGLDSHLSLTRRNGLASILKQMRLYAIAFQNMLK